MQNIDKEKFGHFVSTLRKEKGITQKELARKLYISDKAVSKWETGQSIPAVDLLIPLAEILGVTVTELLECKRLESPHPIAAEDVETIVKKAVSYTDEDKGKRKINRKFLPVYCISLVIAVGQLCVLPFILANGSDIYQAIQLTIFFTSVFGGYFCLFAREKLPAFYDENRLNFMSDGIFRMNIPGVAFNNSNWPNIVGYIRLWCVLCIVFLPAVFIVCCNAIIDILFEIGLYSDGAIISVITAFSVSFILLTLFVPVYFIGKKYE
ncbi:MAG: helix-turn-helix transcriptional regulator [Oscillospiraceae bacterium]|nr:helix-turn-helix transcriptional regulator [Oscillospiraceae bacterium]